MFLRCKHDLILSISANSRGFGFVILEGQLAPVDWGVREAYGRTKNEVCLKRIVRLIDRYQPDLVVLQNAPSTERARVKRICALNTEIANLAESRGIATAFYSRRQVCAYFHYFEAFTKRQIALVIAQHIPALERWVPRIRRPWMSEDSRMGIFDAAALAFRYFHEVPLVQNTPSEEKH
jgi:hypothetical protein